MSTAPATNDHNVYVLGAWFSFDAGIPLVANFLERMRDCHPWLTEKKRMREAHAITQVLAFRLESAGAAYWIQMDLENVEELFSLASAQRGDMGNHVRLAIAATIDYAKRTAPAKAIRLETISEFASNLLRNCSSPDPGNPGKILVNAYCFYVASLLGLFEDGKPRGRNTFITFNYDTLLEETLTKLGVSFSYGFPGSNILFEPNARGDDNASKVTVLKIHGSINWVRSLDPDATVIHPSYAEVRKERKTPQLIPPTWKKAYQKQFSEVMEVAAKRLETATRVIVVGFSMPATDVHFKYLLAAGLAKNISLRKILFIDPVAADLRTRAEALFKPKYLENGRVEFVQKTLAQFVDDGFLLQAIDRAFPYNKQLFSRSSF